MAVTKKGQASIHWQGDLNYKDNIVRTYMSNVFSTLIVAEASVCCYDEGRP
jgi:hypothetical protein